MADAGWPIRKKLADTKQLKLARTLYSEGDLRVDDGRFARRGCRG
jgi:hypothetical protein